ncbi:MAG: substrate-binding domain-containing protein [Firmicutes bacterium]|nr:substrate-binding domain-containing protein [Bacillota bacterium]
MKRKLMVPLLTVVVISMLSLLAGCGSNQDNARQNQNQAATQQTEQAKQPNQPTPPPTPANPTVILATTTSTQDSGLLDVLQPMFEQQTGYKLKIVAVGTGAALAMGQKGNADVLLVHATAAEKPLVDSGVGINYQLVMHNDFVLLGPNNDPAGVKGATTAVKAMKKIAVQGAVFISRGDDSGTNKEELTLWKDAGIDPKGQPWYQESGQGMAATINIANEKQGYTLSDRATYLAQSKHIEMQIVSEGDKSLLNIYHVMNVNPDKFPNLKINAAGGKAFVDFMIAPDTQKVINQFGVAEFGQQLFFADHLNS